MGPERQQRAPFRVAWVRRTTFGLLAAVHLPGDTSAIDADALGQLHDDERLVADTLRGFRKHAWVGGRLAWHEAARALGLSPCPALLAGAGGEPLAPVGLSASISHKRHLALALVADARLGTLGVDLEETGRDHSGIASRVLRPEELKAIAALPAHDQGAEILARFALKEATYKAIYPHLRRYVGFDEATVVHTNDQWTVQLHTREGEPHLRLEASVETDAPYLVATIRAHPA
jgi:4'-phosphopantetheinyl transferase EntD